METDDFNELLRRARLREPQALDQLLVTIRPRLKQLALNQDGFNCAAESVSDLVQEVALRIWKKLDQFQGAKNDTETYAMFLQWVDQVARRMASDMRRDRKAQRRHPANGIVPLDLVGPGGATHRQHEPSTGEQSPSWGAQAEEREQAVQQALRNLADDTARQILCLRFFDGLSLRQISERLDLSYDKVRELYNDTLRHMERELDEFL